MDGDTIRYLETATKLQQKMKGYPKGRNAQFNPDVLWDMR